MFVSDISNIKEIIEYLSDKHEEISKEWIEQYEYRFNINLKRVCVYKFYSDENIRKKILEYVRFMNELTFDLQVSIPYIDEYHISNRVKSRNSIEYKLSKYTEENQHENGKTPLKKCVNDLFGIRAIVPDFINHLQIKNTVDTFFDNKKVKCIERSIEEYNATHIYFMYSDNRAFQWEFQLWNKCNEKRNLYSHKTYKQAYTTWENENKQRRD